MEKLNTIVATQKATAVDELWSEFYTTDAPYHVAYMTYVVQATDEEIFDFSKVKAENVPVSLSVKNVPLSEADYSYTEDTIRDAVLEAYGDFPEYKMHDIDEDRHEWDIAHAGNTIAQKTRRGKGADFIDGFVIYKSNMDVEPEEGSLDAPTLKSLAKLWFWTRFRPDLRFYYTVAKNRYNERKRKKKAGLPLITPNVDAGVIVSEAIINGVSKFALFKHPKFESYGFKLV